MTSVAATAISTIMRIRPGVMFRRRDMERLESITTAVRATHMTAEVSIFTVTASAEQMPRIWMVIGLLSDNGSSRMSLVFAMIRSPGCG